MLKGVFLLVPCLFFIARLFIQVYLIDLVVNFISKVLIVVYHLLRDLFGEFQVITCKTLGGFTIYFTTYCLVNCYTYLELISNTCWAVVAYNIFAQVETSKTSCLLVLNVLLG